MWSRIPVDGSAVDACVRVHKSIYLSIYLSIQARTPEQIAAIRAERAAKREALEARERGSGGS